MKLSSEHSKNSNQSANPKQCWPQHRSPCSWLMGLGLLLLLTTALPETALSALDGTIIRKNAVGPDLTPRAHVGDPITAAITIQDVDGFGNTQDILEIHDVVHNTDSILFRTNATTPPIRLSSTTGPNSIHTFFTTYTVLSTDGDFLPDTAIQVVRNNFDGPGQLRVPLVFSTVWMAGVMILKPSITVTKDCVPGAGPIGTVTYTGSVSNSGNTLLKSVVVSNYFAGGSMIVTNIAALEAHQVVSFTRNYTPSGPCLPATDTLWAWGTDNLSLTVSNYATATCLPKGCPPVPNCPPTTGQVGVPYFAKLTASGGVPPYKLFTIPPGTLPPGLVLNADATITGIPTQAGTFSFTITVMDSSNGTGSMGTKNCNITIFGMGGCRVTGGGGHQLNTFQAICITTPLPSNITHGGQVGAPFSVGSPFTPNDPCISGEWQHNRHLKGNGLVGSLHASGNGHEHQFDSLLCACLPCPQNSGAVGVVGGSCNPGDRTCGPEPSKAPANKICFSGVTDYKFAKRTVKAVFRVDIEDRSEGNSPSSTAPPDRYRMRIWLLDPTCGRNPDPNSAEAMDIRRAASADPEKIAVLATTEDLKVNIPPDIDDGGDMTQGNHQIHKPTGATCKSVIPAPAAAIDVATEVSPLTPGAASFNLTAQGYQGSQDPAFVYRMTITNAGSVTLGNLAVFETTGTDMVNRTSMYFAPGATLAPGATVVRYCTNAWPVDMADTLIVSGNAVDTGMAVSSAGTAVASVGAAEVTATLTLSSPCDADGNPSDDHLRLPAGTSCTVQLNVQVCNTGAADLTGLAVTDNWLNCSRPTFDLAAGACTNLSCSATFSCPGAPLLPLVTVTGRVKPATFMATYNNNGAIITIASSVSGSVDGCLKAPVVCGFVLRDCAGSGNLTGAQGLAGWSVTLRQKGKTIGTVLTDANGAYCFDQLTARDYTITVTPAANYAETVDPDGTLDNTATVTLATGESRSGVNFGYKGTAAAVGLVKTGPASAKRGDTVTYHFRVSNTGNSCFAGGISVVDPLFGGTIWSKTPVQVGEVNEFDKTYVISVTDSSPLVNTATAVGHPGSGSDVTAASTWSINLASAPGGLTATPDNAQVTLSWNAFSGATSYNVKRSTLSGGPYATVKTGATTTTYVDAGLVNDTSYYYVVSAIVGGVESANSTQVSARPAAGLPSPWQSRDVGSVAGAGSASYAGTVRIWTVAGSGADIGGTADAFRYVYQAAVGDCSIVARVTSVQSADPWAKAGVMIRETLTAGSAHMSMLATPGNGVTTRSRVTLGGITSSASTLGLTTPYWVQVVRSGNTFTTSYSQTGSTWTTVSSVSIPMSANAFIGLGVTSHNDGTLSTATFDNVTATP